MTRRIGILEAIDDPAIFGGSIELFPKQRELAAAVEDPRWLQHVWSIGRRSGKSTLCAVLALHNAVFRPDLDELVRPGERRYAMVIATNVPQARVVVQAAASIIEQSPVLRRQLVKSGEDEIVLRTLTGGLAVVAAFPCNSSGLRGRPVSLLILDEMAHMLSTDGRASGSQVLNAAAPSLAQFGDKARLIMSSTPFGSTGAFAEAFHRASSGEEPRSRAAQFPTREFNPTLADEFFEMEQRRDPDMFRTEYGAEFVAGVGAFFDPDRIVFGDFKGHPVEASHRWVAGLDPAMQHDPFGLAVVGRSWQRRRELLVGCVEALQPRRGQESFEARHEATEELFRNVVAVLRPYSVKQVFTDQHAGRAVVDRLTRDGISGRVVAMTGQTRYDMMNALRQACYSGELILPDLPELRQELFQIRVKHGETGSVIVLPRSATHHCDRVVALAQAVYALTRHGLQSGAGRIGAVQPLSLEGWSARIERSVVARDPDGEWEDEPTQGAARTGRSAFGSIDV